MTRARAQTMLPRAAVLILAAMLTVGGPLSTESAAQRDDEIAQYKELAERLLLQSYSSYSYPGTSPGEMSAKLLPGQLSPGLQIDLPVPPGGRLVGSLERRWGEEVMSIEVVLDVAGTAQDAARFYEAALTDRGWITPYSTRGSTSGGGFVQVQPSASSYFCSGQDADSSYVSMTAQPRSPGLTDVRFSVQGSFPSSRGPGGYAYGYGSGPCARPGMLEQVPTVQPGVIMLPALSAPTGISLQTVGYGSGYNVQGSTAMAQTDRRAAELETRFAQQLAEAGWTRIDGQAVGPQAWSRWTVPGEDERAGLLTVTELQPDRVLLSVWMYSTSQEFGPTTYPYGPSFPTYSPGPPIRPSLPAPTSLPVPSPTADR